MKKKKLKLLLKALQAAESARAAELERAHGQPFNKWLDAYESILRQRPCSEHTRKNHLSNIAHLRRLWGAVPINDLKPLAIKSALHEFDGAPSTAYRVLSELREAYMEAVGNGEAESNPALLVRQQRWAVKRHRLTLQMWQSMRTLASTSPQRWVESMLLLALVTGQRRADLGNWRFDDIVTGEDGAQYLRVEQQKKSGKPIGARIEIPLALRLDVIGVSLADVIEHCRNSAKPGPTLLRRVGGGPLELSSLSARFHEHIVAVLGPGALKLYEWPSLHETRSLSAWLYDQQGVDVQTLLGHTAAEMTAVYLDRRDIRTHEWRRVAV